MASPATDSLPVRPFVLTTALSVAALLVLLVLPAGVTPQPSLAQEATSISIDVIPADDTPLSVDTIETCASAQEGDTFNVDLIIENVTDLLAWEITVSYDRDVLEVHDSDTAMFQAANEGSQVLDLSEPTPDDDGQYILQSVDAADPVSPDSGSGVLARLTFKAVGTGASRLSMEKVDLNDDGTLDRGPFLRDVAGEIIGDEDGDTLFDGPINDAEIRVDEPCPGQAAAAAVLHSEDNGGASVSLVAGLALGALAIVALAAATIVFLRRRTRAAP